VQGVSLSCEVLPEYREYERGSDGRWSDVFVKPHMARYWSASTRRSAPGVARGVRSWSCIIGGVRMRPGDPQGRLPPRCRV